jgi:hypothetical protein
MLFALACLALAAGPLGCATEQKVLRTPQYSLTYPAFWKVKSVAAKAGDQTTLSIGRYSDTVMDTGENGNDSLYEKSQADVDVRIVAWPEPPDAGDPAKKVAELLWEDPDLKLSQHGRLRENGKECGQEFRKKFSILHTPSQPLDLMSQPGFRTVVVGGKAQGILVGVVARVPTEQDVGLFCHNLANLQLQLQNVLDGLTLVANGAAAPAPAAAAPAPAAAAPAAAAPTPGPAPSAGGSSPGAPAGAKAPPPPAAP